MVGGTPTKVPPLAAAAGSCKTCDHMLSSFNQMEEEIVELRRQLRTYQLAEEKQTLDPFSLFDGPARTSREVTETGVDGSQVVVDQLSQLVMLMKRSHIEDLPKFSGDPKGWPLFLAVYKRTTELASIDDVTNVGRLTKALEGEARKLVMDQLTFGLDPKEILETLEYRYGRKDVVLRTLSSELMEFPTITGWKDPKLQDFAIALKTYVAQLKALNFESELQNSLLEGLLLDKLTNLPSWYSKWRTRKPSELVPNIEEFAQFVTEQWKALPPLTKSDDSKPVTRCVNVHSAEFESRLKTCIFCYNPGHEIGSCFKFKRLVLNERWKAVRRLRICFSCLKPAEHRASDCPDAKTCAVADCTNNFHSLLHIHPKPEDFIVEESRRPNILNPKSGSILSSPRGDESRSFWSESHQTHGNVSSVTAKVVAVRIHGPDGSFVDDFALLDDGSSLTMIDRRIVDRLKLDGVNESLNLQWTKGITRQEAALKCDITLSGFPNKKFVLKDVFCVENLDLTPVSQNGTDLSKSYRHLKGLPLPDFQGVKPGILIGLEHATFLIGQRVHKGGLNEPLASRTELGWVVYGRQGKVSVNVEVPARLDRRRVGHPAEKFRTILLKRNAAKIAESVVGNVAKLDLGSPQSFQATPLTGWEDVA